jgi:flagellin-specific chaperone FliS
MGEIRVEMPKPELLPEPARVLTDEERAEVREILRELKEMLKNKKGGPLAETLSNVINGIEKEVVA